jgi:hypothetical protein
MSTRPALDVMIGLPDAREAFVGAVRKMGATALFSASAFAARWTRDMKDADRPHPGLRAPPAGRLEGLRYALDSAGFTAASLWGDHVFRPEQYADLVLDLHNAGTPPVWAAAMDLCVEPEVATDREEVLARIMRTAHLYDACTEAFRGRGLPCDPMPVIQGWDRADYEHALDSLDIDWDRIPRVGEMPVVGIGSVCRRPLWTSGGATGLLEIIERLDRILPAGVVCHGFGVKSDALSFLAGHPRMASTDSMAWNTRVRREHPTGRTNEIHVAGMRAWFEAQQEAIASPRGWPQLARLFDESPVRIGAGRSLDRRRQMAEVYHALRNGETDMLGWHGWRTAAALDDEIAAGVWHRKVSIGTQSGPRIGVE